MSAVAAMRFALHASVSTQAQGEDGQSLDTQGEMMRDAVRIAGGIVAKTYAVQESAMPGKERLTLATLFKDAASGAFDAVMVCKMDRLSRSVEVLSHVENNLRDFGISLFEGTEQHNLRSAEGRLTRGMQALIGEYSVNRLKWSACASRLERAKRGWPHSGLVPFGRVVEKVKDRRSENAVWSLDPDKACAAQTMYRLYIDEGLNLTQVGQRTGMNPERVRRIFVEQGGDVWRREFVDPSTGERLFIETAIPPLFNEAQLKRLRAKALQNQRERAQWKGRQRDYPLSQYIRCANPACGWSNLSGHQTTDKRKKHQPREEQPKYAYYLHLRRSRSGDACVNSVPAEQIEGEIFSRLGQLLADSDALESAVRASVTTDPEELRRYEAEVAHVKKALGNARRMLQNALDVVIEQRGNPAARLAQERVDELNGQVSELELKQAELAEKLKVLHVPDDFPRRFALAMYRLTGLHGHIPIHWPIEAKRALLRIFFGDGSTKFDREGRHVRSDRRGIFVSKATDRSGETYWRYEAKGTVADLAGALTGVVSLYDHHFGERRKGHFNHEELQELASLTKRFKGLTGFRSSWHTSTRARWSSRCCTTTPRR